MAQHIGRSFLGLAKTRDVLSIPRVAARGFASETNPEDYGHCRSEQSTRDKPNFVPSKNQSNVKFDQITHTGQAWDKNDRRLARFTNSEKLVNPNIAAHLIAEQKPIACEDHVVFCDGGHPDLGHPRVYINLDKPGTHACGYCGLRFFNSHTTKPEDVENTEAHIQV